MIWGKKRAEQIYIVCDCLFSWHPHVRIECVFTHNFLAKASKYLNVFFVCVEKITVGCFYRNYSRNVIEFELSVTFWSLIFKISFSNVWCDNFECCMWHQTLNVTKYWILRVTALIYIIFNVKSLISKPYLKGLLLDHSYTKMDSNIAKFQKLN